jgi:hypothetical protein
MMRYVDVVSAGLTIAVTPYSSGDQVGTVFAIPGAVDNSGGRAIIRGGHVLDESAVMGAFDLLLFSANPSATPGDNNPFTTLSDADARLLTAYMSFAAGDVKLNTLSTLVNWSGKDTPYVVNNAALSLYGVIVTRTANAIFTAVTDLRLRLFMDVGSYNSI